MLGKLLKHELRQTGRFVVVIYAVLAALAAFLLISSAAGATAFKVLSNAALSIGTIVMAIMTLVAIIRNFRESLYGRQGYLSFTLPVKGSTLLTSKVIVSVIWLICSVVISALVYIVMYVSATGENGIEALGTLKDIIDSVGLNEMLPNKGVMTETIILAALFLLANMIVIVAFIYFSVTLANTRPLQAHPVFYGIGTLLVIYIVFSSISRVLTQYVPLSLNIYADKLSLSLSAMGESEALLSYGLAGTIFQFLGAVGLLILTGWIMERKVNLK